MLDRISYRIADLFFAKHLEADYEMGLREGSRVTYMVMAAQIRRMMPDAPKNAQPGLNLALKMIEERIH